jgi:hypothetical protein
LLCFIIIITLIQLKLELLLKKGMVSCSFALSMPYALELACIMLERSSNVA